MSCLVGGVGTSGRVEDVGEKMWENEYSANILYTCMQIKK
jgi:hypothetical protein